MTLAVVNVRTANPPPRHVGTRLLGLACLFGAFLAVTGALDTQAATTPARMIFWISISIVGAVALEAVHRLLSGWLLRRDGRWNRGIAVAVVILPLTLLATITCKLLFGGRPSAEGFAEILPGMTGILSGLQLILTTFAVPPKTDARIPPVDEQLLRTPDGHSLALPIPLQGACIEAIRAEDHYVRVYTDKGSTLLRMRFCDALAAISHLDGVRAHRSWWVARDSILSLGRPEGRTTLTLSNGLRVPVSRACRAALGPPFRRS